MKKGADKINADRNFRSLFLLEWKAVSVDGMRGTDSLNFTVLKARYAKGIEIVQNRGVKLKQM